MRSTCCKRSDPKVAILRQNDDVGMDYLNGFMEGLGKDGERLVAMIAPMR